MQLCLHSTIVLFRYHLRNTVCWQTSEHRLLSLLSLVNVTNSKHYQIAIGGLAKSIVSQIIVSIQILLSFTGDKSVAQQTLNLC